MPRAPSWLRHASQSLATRLDRLRQTFDHFRDQLREAVSSQVSQTLANAVRDAVCHLLDDRPGYRPTMRRSYSQTRDPMWDENDPWADPAERWEEEQDRYESSNESLPPTQDYRTNLNQAVLVGCEAAAWWLRQRWGRLPLLAAFLVGGLSAATSYVGGPVAAAGVALAGSAVSLLALVRSSSIATEPPE